MKGAGLYQDRGTMGKLPVHRKMEEMFPHSAPTQESDWLRYRGTAMDEMKSGNFDGAVKQKATGHDSESDYKSIGSFKNQKGITVHGYQSKGTGKKIFKGEKQGNFSSAQESDFNAAKKYQEFQASKGK